MNRRDLNITAAIMVTILFLFGFKVISIDAATDQAIILVAAAGAVIIGLWLAYTGPEDEE